VSCGSWLPALTLWWSSLSDEGDGGANAEAWRALRDMQSILGKPPRLEEFGVGRRGLGEQWYVESLSISSYPCRRRRMQPRTKNDVERVQVCASQSHTLGLTTSLRFSLIVSFRLFPRLATLCALIPISTRTASHGTHYIALAL
jgi:hypothetical protein